MTFVLVALLLPALAAFAQVCSGSGPTLKTIAVDGESADWDTVLANPMQVTSDAAWTTNCAGSTDRDCEGNGNLTGRDLNIFAWTFDANNIYLYTTRFGSSSNFQVFYFYMDFNSNKRMNSGEKVLEVRYQGSSRLSQATLFDYIAADAVNGDSMVATSGPYTGYADGYRLPGTLPLTGSAIYASTLTGFADGSGFESYVPFAALGVPSGTAIFFHVSSSNTSIAGAPDSNQIDDNCGGPDGRNGAFAFFSATLTPNQSSTINPGNPATQTYLHTLANTGTLDDRYNLTAVSSQGFSLDVYDDNTNQLMASDTQGDGSWDYVNAGYNFDADGAPDVALAFGATFVLRLTLGTTSNNLVDVTTLRAISAGDPSCQLAKATDTTTVQVLPPGLMRNAGLNTLNPTAAQKAAIFPRAPGDPSLSSFDTVVPSHSNGAPFPTETSDLTDTSIVIIFYQLENGNPNMRVLKEVGNGKLKINH